MRVSITSGTHHSSLHKKKCQKVLFTVLTPEHHGFTLPWLFHSSLNPTCALPPSSLTPDLPSHHFPCLFHLPQCSVQVVHDVCVPIFELNRNNENRTKTWSKTRCDYGNFLSSTVNTTVRTTNQITTETDDIVVRIWALQECWCSAQRWPTSISGTIRSFFFSGWLFVVTSVTT